MTIALLAVLLLQPTVADEADLRLVATGTGSHAVDWTVDGATVATTRDGEPAVVRVAAGTRAVHAHSDAPGAWRALARPEASGPGAVWVPAWSATAPAPPPVAAGAAASSPVLAACALAGAALTASAALRPVTKRP